MIDRVLRVTGAGAATLLIALATLTGCRSYHVQISVENHTGAAIQLLEVDYPSASFGADSLPPDGTINYAIQVRGSGPVKVQYTLAGVAQKQISGPSLSEGDEGRLKIVLLPGDKAAFTPQLSHR
jgi:hypothetical protein